MKMQKTVSSTTAVREFSDLLARVQHGGQRIVITRNGAPVAQIAPAREAETMTLRAFLESWTCEVDEEDASEFAKDLEKIQRADKPAQLKWDT